MGGGRQKAPPPPSFSTVISVHVEISLQIFLTFSFKPVLTVPTIFNSDYSRISSPRYVELKCNLELNFKTQSLWRK